MYFILCFCFVMLVPKDVDACDPDPCVNYVNCTNVDKFPNAADYICYCKPGWTGKNCTEGLYTIYTLIESVILNICEYNES